jgi:hypothetical protein
VEKTPGDELWIKDVYPEPRSDMVCCAKDYLSQKSSDGGVLDDKPSSKIYQSVMSAPEENKRPNWESYTNTRRTRLAH